MENFSAHIEKYRQSYSSLNLPLEGIICCDIPPLAIAFNDICIAVAHNGGDIYNGVIKTGRN